MGLAFPLAGYGVQALTSRDNYATVDLAVADALARGLALSLLPGDAAVVAVPSAVSTIAGALSAIRDWRIPPGAMLTITVADGTYVCDALRLEHADGSRVFLEGNTTTPVDCVLQFAGTTGIYTPFAMAIGGFDGFRLEKTGANEGVGVLADTSFISCGPHLEIDNFYYGIAARKGGMIVCNGISASERVEVSGAGDVGIWAYVGSTIECRYAHVTGSSDVANNLGFGIMAEYGSAIECQYAETDNNHRAGIASYSGSSVRAYNTDTHDNTTHGYEVVSGSSLVAHSGTSTDNGGYGAYWDQSSGFSASPAVTYSGNTSGTEVPSVLLDFSSQPRISPRSPNATESIRVDSKGAGDHYFNNGAGLAFHIVYVASAVNRMQLRASVTGSAPKFTAVGSDTDIDIEFSPKNAGTMRFGTHSAIAAETVSGYITIKDTGGTSRKLAVVS